MTYPVRYHPQDGVFSSGWHADYSADNPDWIAASVGNHNLVTSPTAGYSSDGGTTWTSFAALPTATFFAGSIHVGQPGHIIWISSQGKGAYRTTDSGATWSTLVISGVTVTTVNTKAFFFYRRPACSEKTAGVADTFYVHTTGTGTKGVFISTDAGANWTQQCDNTPFNTADWTLHSYLKSVPDHAGHLFHTPGYQTSGGSEVTNLPFKRSTDGGVTWTTISTIQSVRGYDFGVGLPGATYPSIFAVGYVGGVVGVYRSDDQTATWTLLTTQPNGTVDFIRNVGASKDSYGEHWVTTAGSGLIHGKLA